MNYRLAVVENGEEISYHLGKASDMVWDDEWQAEEACGDDIISRNTRITTFPSSNRTTGRL